MKRPVIGVVPLWDEQMKSLWMLPGYMDGIEQAGGIPLMLPLTSQPYLEKQLIPSLDGFLVTGGQDTAPGLYGQEMDSNCGELCHARDEMEQILFRAALALDKPVFGICRGIQFFNVLMGGDLYQDIPSGMRSDVSHQQKNPYNEPAHSVRILEGTPLHDLLQNGSIVVNSCHHQGIKTLASGLLPMAKSDDGLIEAVYLPAKKFAWAVQWHPEHMLEEEHSRSLFRAFVRRCAEG